MVYGESRLLPAITIFDENFRSTVRESAGQPVEFLTEFLDVDRFPVDRYEPLLTGFLRGKYQDRPVDVIVAAGSTALKFLLRHRGEILPGVPVVHAVITQAQLAALAPPPDVVGLPMDSDPLPTLELALRLQPKARCLILVTGTSDMDREWERQLRVAVPRLSREVRTEFLAGLPMPELQDRLRALPADAAVFVPTFLRDGAGRAFVSREAVAQIAAASTVPVYGPFDTYIGTGIVGGYMPTFEAIGRGAGEIASRLLNGEAPSALRPAGPQRSDYILDWRQLRRFGIDPNALPRESILKFREPSFWEAYRARIATTAAVVLLQAALIALLLWERRSRRRANTELRESEKRMSLAANATGVGMWLWDIARDDIWATPQARALYGIPGSEPIDFDRFLRTVHSADRESTKKGIEEALATGNDFELQYRVIHPEGEIRWVSARGQVESGAIVGVSLDITARKAAELAADRHRGELVRMSRAGLLGQLSGAIAHELNQPLTAILSNAQAAQRLLGREPPDLEEIRDIFKDIVEEDRRAVEVIRRLRALFKQGGLQRQPLEVNELVREVLKLVHSDLLTRHVTLVAELADGLPTVAGDRVQLQQVLLNLIVNACESMAENEPDGRKLAIRADPGEDGVVVEVADSGKGIDPEGMERLFEPFFTTKPHGMGMGLAICRSIMEAHGGKLTASNNPNRGATFRFSLPVEGDSSP
jgi:signal transduction histidine kinase